MLSPLASGSSVLTTPTGHPYELPLHKYDITRKSFVLWCLYNFVWLLIIGLLCTFLKNLISVWELVHVINTSVVLRTAQLGDYCVQDIRCSLQEHGAVPLGSEFTVTVRAQNTSRQERTINLTLTIFAVHYTGLARTKLRSEIFNFNLCPLRRQYSVMSLHYSYTHTRFHSLGQL